jgi:hypothetical protein
MSPLWLVIIVVFDEKPIVPVAAVTIWHSNRNSQATRPPLLAAIARPAPKARADKRVAQMPQFIAPQLCKPVSRPRQAIAGSMRLSLMAIASSYGSSTGNLSCALVMGSTGLKTSPQSHLRPALESVREHQAGLQSFRSMRRIDARRKNASALRLRFSQSLASDV